MDFVTCSGSWLDQHEALAVWLGGVASFFVAIVALGVVFLQQFLQRRSDLARDNERVALNSFLAANHARGALLLIDEWQHDLFDRVKTPTGGRLGRQWRFELAVSEETVKLALETEIRDPALVQNVVKVRAWLRDTLVFVTRPPEVALHELQFSTNAREQAAQQLKDAFGFFIDASTGRPPKR